MVDYKFLIASILKHLDEGIIVVDIHANVTFFNEPATNIAGITEQKAIGKNILDIFPDLTPESSTFYRVLNNKEPIIDHVQTYLTYQGRRVSTVTSTIPLIKNGELVGALEIYRDLTQVRELSDKVVNLQSQLFRKDGKERFNKGNGTIYFFEDIIGENAAMAKLKERAKKIADSTSPVLVFGETGTGKELLVQAIHNSGEFRKNKPFIAQNCAALPKTLLESILFGTAAGSFTGAKEKPGLFELAHGGTLFLDEINLMDMELQGKLLRVLQDGVVRKVGGMNTIKVDVRIMASTNEPPMQAVEQKRLREDLYYRLNVINFKLPPLRDRKEDIPILIKHFIEVYNKKLHKNVKNISIDALNRLKEYYWPGNIRELMYTIESIMNFIENGTIQISDLPNEILKREGNIKNKEMVEDKSFHEEMDLSEALWCYEKDLIANTMEKANGNGSRAARMLNIPRQTLHNKIKKFGVHWETKAKG